MTDQPRSSALTTVQLQALILQRLRKETVYRDLKATDLQVVSDGTAHGVGWRVALIDNVSARQWRHGGAEHIVGDLRQQYDLLY